MTPNQFKQQLRHRYVTASHQLAQLKHQSLTPEDYQQIANDYTLGLVWSTVVTAPFEQHASYQQLEQAMLLLERMLKNPDLINTFRRKSLYLRGQTAASKFRFNRPNN